MKTLFVHVPRCGGMSFYYFLEEVFGKENSIRFGDNSTVSIFLESAIDYNDFLCLSGHVPYPFFQARGCQKKRFTIAFVRDPKLRELSCFSHMRGNDYIDHLSIPTNTQTEYWKYFSFHADLHNIQSSYFCEDRTHNGAKNSILENKLCVFDVEDIFLVADIIKSFIGVEFMPAHTNGSDREQLELSPAGVTSIEKFCAEDIKLHTWVKNNRQFFLDQLKIELWRNYLQSSEDD